MTALVRMPVVTFLAMAAGLTVAASPVIAAPTQPVRAVEGTDVAYLALTKGMWQVWVMHSDGSGARQITRSLSDKTRISWYPIGDRLLVNTNQGSAYAVELASGKETGVELGVKPVLDAVLSPDGAHIAFSFNGADSPDGHDLWIETVDGSDRHRLTDMPGLQHEPTWSEDGAFLYFLSGSGKQTHDIWRLELRSANREQLTAADLYHFDVAVSPRGDLAFSANSLGNYEIFLQTVGRAATALTQDNAFAAHPSFSPDGGQILFESTRSGSLQIWKLELESKRLIQVTHDPSGARAPVWRHKPELAR
jgi:TolB protein